MARAIYHKGLTVEYDSRDQVLLIEGQDMEIRREGEEIFCVGFPKLKAKNLEALARLIIENAPYFTQREKKKKEHLDILSLGVAAWNQWREQDPHIRPILYEADLRQETFDVIFDNINFSNADLRGAKLSHTSLKRANFHEANLGSAKLCFADLEGANFCRTDLYKTDLSNANLNGANLQGTQLAMTNFARAELVNCKIYGMSAWDLNLEGAVQENLIIVCKEKSDPKDASAEEFQYTNLLVDDLQMAQFIYLMLNNEKIREIIDTITSKAVLILGNFSPERKEVLDQLKEELRKMNYVPILFDFSKPRSKNITDTVMTLARMSSFVIADLTQAKYVRQELQAIIPNQPSLPVRLIVQEDDLDGTVFQDWLEYHWVLEPFAYRSQKHLLSSLSEQVIRPAKDKFDKILRNRQAFEKKYFGEK